MGNGYKNHIHPQTFYQKSSFLPMLCRLSLKDVRLSSHCNKDRSSSTIDEPSLSPKVSCMGQVKRKNNKVIGFPTPYRINNSSSSSANTTPSKTSVTHHQIKYTKLKKLFSSKNLINGGGFSTTAAFNGGGGGGSKSCVSSKEMMRLKGVVVRKQEDMMMMMTTRSVNGDLNVGELDPPLPVIKKVQEPGAGRDEINIWKRRFNGGGGIKGLQIDQIHLPGNNNFLPPPPTTV